MTAAYNGPVKPLVALLALLLLAAAAPPVTVGPVRHCAAPAPADCTTADLVRLRLERPETTLVRSVHVDAAAMPLERPLMVWMVAMASSEVRWNGSLIGRNGVPGPDRASETPGRFFATFTVPAHLVRPGENIVSVRLSAHHLWLPVRRVVHVFDVGHYETQTLPGLSAYLPALLVLGALVAACIYFSAAVASDRSDRRALLLALIAGFAILQLLVEVARTFVAYSYPWHLARVAAIALLAAVIATLVAAYAARRFALGWERRVVLLTGGASAASLLLVPWYDLKALGAILAAAAGLAVCAARGLKERRRLAGAGLLAALAIVALMAFQLTAFLDRGWFILLAILLVGLVADQVRSLKRARAQRDSETRRAAALAERLARAEREGEPIVALKDGARTHRVAESDILFVRAADDYCEAVLADGRTLLVTMTLARLLAALPDRFMRVHKSYAVNRARVISVAPRPGGGRLLRLSDGSDVPVGRSYGAAVSAWTGGVTPSPSGG